MVPRGASETPQCEGITKEQSNRETPPIKMRCPPRDAQRCPLQGPAVLSSPCGSVWGAAFLVLRLLPSSLTRQVEGKCWALAPRPREKDSVPLLSSFGPSCDPTSYLWRAPCMLQGVGSKAQPHFSGKIWLLSPPISSWFSKDMCVHMHVRAPSCLSL